MALSEPVFHMMRRGIRVDEEKKAQLRVHFENEWSMYQSQLNSIAGHEVNVNSPKQVKEFLYHECGLPERRYQGRVTTREDSIRSLLPICKQKLDRLKTDRAKLRWKRGFVGINLILQIRGTRKLLSSYVNAKTDEDGRMRTTLSIGGTETFRFSSSKTLWDTGCNLQTIPRKLRVMFIPDEGMELCELDLNRGESWIYSHLAQEPTMMQIHRDGEDFHSITACAISDVFGEPVRYEEWEELERSDPDRAYKLRYTGKRTNHASAYRMGPYRMAQVVNKEADETHITLSKTQAKECQEVWLRLYPFIERWWDRIEQELNDNNRTLVTPYGRTRQFHERWGESLFKEATAYIPQSTSVDYLNGGMLRVYNELVKPGDVDLLHQNHDSILVQFESSRRDELIPQISELLTSTLRIGEYEISIPVEAGYGPNWKDLTKYAEAA